MRGVLNKVAALAVVAVLMLATMSHAVAGAPITHTPDGTCIGIIHFPAVPVDDAPSKAVLGLAFSPDLAGSLIMIDLSGASGDVFGDDVVGPDGRVFVEAPLYSYGPHSVEQIMVEDPSGVVGNVEVDVFGDGGTFVVDDEEPMCDESTLPASQPPAPSSTTATSSTTTTSSSTTTTTEPPTTSEPSSTQPGTTSGATGTTSGVTETTPPDDDGDDDDDGGGSILPPVLILVGGVILVGGIVLIVTGKKEDDCDRERENLAAAQRRLEMINETLQEALGDLAEQEAEITDLESQLDGYNKAKGKGSTVDNKVRYYAYGGGRISEGELEAQIEYYEARLRIAREARAKDEARVEEWHQKFQAAEQEVREAEEALYRCLGESAPAAPAPPTPPSVPTTPGPSGPSGPAISEPPEEEETRPECEDGATYTEQGTSERLDQFVDFAIIVQVAAGTGRKVAEAELMSFNLAQLAANIDTVGDALGARGAGKSIAGGFRGLHAGEYVMGGGRLIKGTAEGAMASGAVDFEVPTSPPEAITEVLEGIAGFGSFVAGKVGEWLKMNQIYEVHMTLFKQTITATPYKLWVCEDGRWKCRRLWQYSVGKLVKGGSTTKHSFRLESDVQRHRMNAEISRLSSRAQWSIRESVRKRAEFDAKHQPGPCE